MGFAQGLGSIVGGIGGAIVGGPAGALAGFKVGGDLGKGIDKKKSEAEAAEAQQQLAQQSQRQAATIAQQQIEAANQAKLGFQPAIDAGQAAFAEKQALMGIGTPEQIAAARGRIETPGAGFVREQGVEDIQRAASAGGRLQSGSTIRNLADFNAQLSQSLLDRRLANLSQDINAGTRANEAVSNLTVGGASRAGQFTSQGQQQFNNLSLGAIGSDLASKNAFGEGLSSAIDTGITASIAGGVDPTEFGGIFKKSTPTFGGFTQDANGNLVSQIPNDVPFGISPGTPSGRGGFTPISPGTFQQPSFQNFKLDRFT